MKGYVYATKMFSVAFVALVLLLAGLSLTSANGGTSILDEINASLSNATECQDGSMCLLNGSMLNESVPQNDTEIPANETPILSVNETWLWLDVDGETANETAANGTESNTPGLNETILNETAVENETLAPEPPTMETWLDSKPPINGSFKDISAKRIKASGKTKLSSGGYKSEIDTSAYDMLAKNRTVRIIVKADKMELHSKNMTELGSIDGRGLQVLEMNQKWLATLVQSGATKIYLDTEMSLSLDESIPLIRADAAKDSFGVSGSGIAICLLDTGVDYSDEQFEGTAASGYDFINNDTDAMDDNGHGTLMASAIHRIAPGATIIAVKVLDSSGHGYASDVISGIDFCREVAANNDITGDKIKIISMSFGGGNFTGYCDSSPIAAAIQDAYDAGILSVASSGNGGLDAITMPACAASATAVASTNKSDAISSFSNINPMVDLLAPGEEIIAQGLGGAQTVSGTSMSAAHVSGAAALLFETDGDMAPFDAEERFRATGILVQQGSVSYPRIDALNALMNNLTGIPETPAVNETNETYEGGFETAAWADATFDRCKNITVWNTGATVLTNFPALVNLTYDSDMMADYSDLRFYNTSCGGDPASKLDYEIENYTASNALIWVRVPSIAVGNITNISVYYKNNTAHNGEQNKTGVWNVNYVGVWHLQEQPNATAPQMKDSTANTNDCTTAGSMTGAQQVAGKVDGSLNFLGTDDTANCGNDAELRILGNLTVEAWAKPSANATTIGIFTKMNATSPYTGWQLRRQSNNTFAFVTTNTTADTIFSNLTYTDNNWHHIVGTLAGTQKFLFVDGVRQLSNSTSQGMVSNFENVTIGRRYADGTGWWTGGIDEVRISNTTRTPEWINMTYSMMATNNGRLSFGAEQNQPTIDTASPAIEFATPTDNSSTTVNRAFIQTNVSAEDSGAGLKNITIYLHNATGALINSSTSATSPLFANFSVSAAGTYYFNATAYDNAGNLNKTETRNITIAPAASPTVALVSPHGNYTNTDGNVSFIFNVSSSQNILNCTLIINSTVNQTIADVARGQNQAFNLTGLEAGCLDWGVNCMDGLGNSGASETRRLDLVLATEFSGESTNLSQVPDLSSIANLTLEKPLIAKLEFQEQVDLSCGADLDAAVKIAPASISVNSTKEPRLNKKARLYFFNLPYAQTPILLKDGAPCEDCTIMSYINSTLKANVTHFTNYTTGANSNLTIWDETDGLGGSQTRYAGNQTRFFANYSNRTSNAPINGSGIGCSIAFSDSGSNMPYNATSKLYEYNRSFGSPGAYAWNVTCNGSSLGYEVLNATDTVSVSAPGTVQYNFSQGGAANKAYQGNTSGALPPASGPAVLNETEFNATHYAQINSSDSSFVLTTSSSGYRTQRFLFNITQDRASLLQINITWKGNSSGNTASRWVSIYAWNFTSSSWGSPLFRYNPSASTLFNVSLNSGFSDYVNGSGAFTFIAEGESATALTLAGDYAALTVYYDSVAPTAAPASPADGNITAIDEADFVCNATDDASLKNVTLYWNYSGAWQANATASITGISNSSTFSKSQLANGAISWNCYACDNSGKCSFAEFNSTVIVNSSTSTIFFDGFESGNLDQWNRTAVSGANNWTVLTTSPYKGTYHAQSNPVSTSNPASIMDINISTSGYNNITFSYYRWLVLGTALKNFTVKWYDGASWNTLESTVNVDEANYTYKTFALPASASKNQNLRIRFECTSGATGDFCRLDNVKVTGIAVSTVPIVNSVSVSPDPVAASSGTKITANATDDINISSVILEIMDTNYSMAQQSPIGGSYANLFEDGFESGSVASNWAMNGTKWWSASSQAAASGSYSAQIQQSGAGEPSSMEAGISTAGFQNITVSYYKQLVGLDAADAFKAEWYNGSVWTTIEDKGSGSEDDADFIYANFSLPAGASNTASFKLRFTCECGAVTEYCRIDDVDVGGSHLSGSTDLWEYYYVTDSSGVYNYTIYANDSDNNWAAPKTGNFTVYEPNVTISEDSVNAFGESINVTLEILDTEDNTVYNQTSTVHHKTLPKGLYKIKVKPKDQAVKEVIFDNVPVSSDISGFVDIDAPSASKGFGREYAIKMNSQLEATVVVNASAGKALFACDSWDFETQSCASGKWKKSKDIGSSEYNFSVSSNGEVAFGENNETLVLVDSGDNMVDSNQSVLANSSGILTVLITPSSDLIENITVYGHNESSGQYDISIEHPSAGTRLGMGFFGNSELYSINASGLDFDNATVVTINSTGHDLYKCGNWSFAAQRCNDGNWTLFKTGLVAGQAYSFVIMPGDPGFAEIDIIKAEHLNETRGYIENIYPEVSARDYVYKEIPVGHYARVVFQDSLTSLNDITIFARSNYSNASIQVYEKDSGTALADFGAISGDGKYKVLLSNLSGSQDTFDLGVSGDPVEFDYVVDPPWADTNFTRCKNITIRNAGASTLTDFPALVNLSYDSDMQTNYADLRFYDQPCNSGGSLMDYEIENYTGANALVWVRVPSLPTPNTTISVYYGNSTSVGSGQNATGVWNSGYVMVLHLAEAGTGPRFDSTRYGNNGTPTNYDGDEKTTGKVDGADDLDGASTGDYVQTTANVTAADNITFEIWFDSDNITPRNMMWQGSGDGNGWGAQGEMHISMGAWTGTTAINNQISYYLGTESFSDATVIYVNRSFTDTTNFHHAAFTVGDLGSSPAGTAYLDGGILGTDTGTVAGVGRSDWNTSLRIGQAGTGTGRYFDGIVDEVRVSNISRSSDWINETYQVVANQSTFVVVGPEESQPIAGRVTVTINSPVNTYNSSSSTVNFNWTCTGSSTSFLANLTIDSVINASSLASLNNTATNRTITGIVNGNHNWSVACWNGTTSNTSGTYNFTVDTVNPTVQFVTPTGNSSSVVNRSYIFANVTATDSGLKNITIYLYNSTGLYNSTNATTSPLFINWTALPDGIYYINATAYDNAGNFNKTETRNITISIPTPSIANLSLNATSLDNLTTDNLTCNYVLNGSATTAAVTWYRNGSSIMMLNMPFEGGSNSTWTADYSGYGRDGTVNGSTWNATGGYDGNGAYQFDGSNDYIILPQNTTEGLTKFTIALWVKTGFANTTCTNLWQCPTITGTGTTGAGSNDFGIAMKAGNISMWSGLNGSDLQMVSSVLINNSQWHFIVAANNGTVIKLYSDGINIGNLTSNGSALAAHRFDIGAIYYQDNTDNYFFNGSIDAVMIYNYSLSPEQIQALYQNRTDLIVEQETEVNDTWQCRVTPFSSSTAGPTNASNNVTINAFLAPSVTLNAPPNGYNSSSSTVDFNWTCTGSSTSFLANLTIDSVINASSLASLNNTATNRTVTGLTNGNHNWSVKCWNGTMSNTSATWNFTVDTVNPAITFVTPTDNSSANYSRRYVQINVSATDATSGVKNITIYLYNSTGALINSSNTTSGSLFANFSVNADGNYSFNATAFDNAGNLNKTETRNITIDTTNPIIQFVTPTTNTTSYTTQTYISANVTATDSGTGVKNVTIYLYNSTGLYNSTASTYINWTGLPDGNYSFNATAFDNAGNQNKTETRSISIETENPAIQFVTPTDNSSTNYSRRYIQINVTATDATSGLQNITIYLYNSTGAQINTSNTTSVSIFANFSVNDDGNYSFNATAFDNAGNQNKTETRSITIDTINPTITFTTPTDNSSTNYSRRYVQINVSATDATSGVKNITIYLYNSTGAQINSSTGTAAFLFANFSVSADGSYSFNTTTFDNAGNLNSTETRNMTIDTTAPTITLNQPSNNTAVNYSSMTFNFTATDAVSSTMSCSLYIDGTLNQTNATVSNNTLTTFSNTGLTDRLHTWYVACTDGMGNIGNSLTYGLVIDLTAPTISLNLPANNTLWNVSTLTFNFTVVENINSTFSCSIYLDSVLNQTNATTINNTMTNFQIAGLSEGLHTWYVRCTDYANNTGQSGTNSISIDLTAPTITINSPANNSIFNVSALDFAFTPMDNNAGTFNCSLYFDGTINQTNLTTINSTLTAFSVASSSNGFHLWYIKCTDSALNTRVSGTYNLTVDTVNPIIVFTAPTDNASAFYSRRYINANISGGDIASGIKNLTIMLYNSTGSLINSSTTSLASLLANFSVNYDGIYYLNATVFDNANNTNKTETRNITIDTINPVIYFTTPTDNSSTVRNSSFIQINISATDTNLKNATIYIYDSTSLYNSTASTFINWTGMPDGTYYINATAFDYADNFNKTETRNITIDTTAPTVNPNLPASNAISNISSVVFNFTFTDAFSSTANCSLYLDGTLNQTNATVSNNTLTSFQVSGIVDDVHNWYIRCIDSAGNAGTGATRQFTVDTTSPNIVPNLPANNSVFNYSTITFNFTATDNTASTFNCSIYLNGVLNQSNTSTINNTPTSFTTSGLLEGQKLWYFRCTDIANNTAVSGTRNITIDTINPTIEFTSPTDNSSTFKSLPYLYINVSAADTYFANLTIFVYNSTDLIYNKTQIAWCYQEFANESTPCGGMGNGTYSYSTSNWTDPEKTFDGDWDTYGRADYGEDVFLWINYTKPAGALNNSLWQIKDDSGTTNIAIPADCWNVGATLQLRMYIWDDEEVDSDCFNGTDWDNLRGSASGLNFFEEGMWWDILPNSSFEFLNLSVPSSGLYHFNATVQDLAGNINSTETRNVTIDTANPAITFMSPTDNDSTAYDRRYVEITANATDANLKNVTVYLYNSSGGLVNTSTSTSSPLSANFSVNADGNYSFNATTFDNAGNMNKTETRNITIDSTNPAIFFDTPTTNTTAFTTVNYITANVSATDANLYNVTIFLYNATGLYNSTASTYINWTALPEGVYYFNATAYDTAGNMNATETRNTSIDSTNPAISFISPTTNTTPYVSNNYITANVSAIDTSLNNVTIYLYNATGLYNITTSATSPIYINWTALPDGNYSFNATAFDSAGRFNKTETRAVSIDTINPAITFTTPTDNSSAAYARRYVEITATSTDANLKNVTIFLYNSTGGLVNTSTSTSSPLSANFSVNADGNYSFSAIAFDNADNFNSTETRNITIDTTNPAITFMSPTDNDSTAYDRRYVEITANATDANLNNVTIFLYNSTGGLVNTSTSTSSPLSANFSVNADGNYSFSAIAFDNADNLNITETRNVTIDTVNPAIFFDTPTTNTTAFTTVNYITANVSATDASLYNVTIFLYNATGLYNSTTSATSPIYINWTALPEGVYYFNATAYDIAGNMNATETRNITIDTTNPAIEFTAPTDNSSAVYARRYVQVNVTATDANLNNLTVYLYNSTGALINSSNTTASALFANFTGLPYGNYSFNATAYDLLGNANSTETRSIRLNSPPTVIVISPTGETINFNDTAYLVIDASDPDGINSSIARITLPNGTAENVTLNSYVISDNFNNNSVGTSWIVENSSIGQNQTCIADINSTAPGGAYTSISGNGSPETDTLCSLISEKFIYGDFDINISFNITGEAGTDNALNFEISADKTSVLAVNYIFVSLSHWTGQPRQYQIFGVDSNFSDYVGSRETDDTAGKFRIKRTGNNFTFYTFNNSDGSWIEESVSKSDFNLSKGVYVLFETESAAPNWGNLSVVWDDLSAQYSNYSVAAFNDTSRNGTYNVQYISTDSFGAVNDSQTTYFNVIPINSPPTVPFELLPFNGQVIRGLFDVTWTESIDPDGDNLKYNITLLNPDYTANSTIVSAYGDPDTNNYVWNTTQFSDGTYSIDIMVYENQTNEHYSRNNYLIGNFTIDNTPASVTFESPTTPTGSFPQNWIFANVTATDSGPGLANITVYLYNSTGGLVNSTTLNSSPLPVNYTGLPDNAYYLNATAEDLAGNINSTETRNITIDTVNPAITFTTPTDNSSAAYARRYVEITANATDANLQNVTIYLYNSTGGLVNTSTSATSPLSANFSVNADGNYSFNATTFDNAGNSNKTETRNITIDSTNPAIFFDTPTTNTTAFTTLNYITANVSAIDTSLNNVTIFLYNATGLYNSTASTYINWTALPEGVYYFNATAYDTAGNMNATETRNTSIDSTNPAISFISPTTNTTPYVSNNYITANVSAIDTSLNNVTIFLYNATGLYNSTTSGTSPLYINWTGLPDGNYSFNATAFDSAGRFNKTETRTVSIDTINPAITFTTPTDNSSAAYARRYVEITATSTDANLNNVTIFLYNSTGALINFSTSATSPLSANFSVNADGNYSFNATTFDNADNFNITETRNVTIDTVNPAITFTTPTDNSSAAYARRYVEITATSTDANLKNVTVYLYNSTGGLINTSTSTSSPLSANFSVNDDGNYSFNATTFDNAGNMNKTETRNITIDTVTPTIEFPGPTTNSTDFTPINYITVNASASDENLDTITIYLYNETELFNSTNSTTSPSFINWTNLPDGTYHFNATVSDNAGNINSTETRNVTIDTLNPTIEFPGPTTNTTDYTAADYVTINVSAEDANLDTITVYLYNDTGLFNSTNSTTSPSFINWTGLPDGTYYFNATVNDSAGRANSTETRNVTIDTVNPTIEFSDPTTNSTASTAQTWIYLNVSPADAHLNETVLYLYNATGLYNSTNTTSSINWTNLPDGTYYWNATVSDKAGNLNSTETRTMTIDATGPAIVFAAPTDNSSTTYRRLYVIINVSATDMNLSNVTIFLYNSTGALINSSTSTTSPLFANFSVDAYGTYYFNATAYDGDGNFNSTGTRTFVCSLATGGESHGGPSEEVPTVHDLEILPIGNITATMGNSTNVAMVIKNTGNTAEQNIEVYIEGSLVSINFTIPNLYANESVTANMAVIPSGSGNISATAFARNGNAEANRTFTITVVSQCVLDSDCPATQHCSGNACIDRLPDNASCTESSECLSNSCLGGVCGECRGDSDCAESQVCTAGKCEEIPGECGYFSSHAFFPYQCCAASDCGALEQCANHTCVAAEFIIIQEGEPAENQSVSIVIVDINGVPIPGIQVIGDGFTDKDGRATVTAPPGGRICIVFGNETICKKMDVSRIADIFVEGLPIEGREFGVAVRDLNETPVRSVDIFINGRLSAKTDESGRASVSVPNSGDAAIGGLKPGYSIRNITVNVIDSKTICDLPFRAYPVVPITQDYHLLLLAISIVLMAVSFLVMRRINVPIIPSLAYAALPATTMLFEGAACDMFTASAVVLGAGTAAFWYMLLRNMAKRGKGGPAPKR